MVKRYRVKVNGKEYMVEVEELKEVSKTSKAAPAVSQPTKVEEPVVNQSTPTQPIPSPAPKVEQKPSTTGGKVVKSPMAGVVVKVLVNEGQKINVGDIVLVFEAMKMENELRSEFSGVVSKILVKEGDAIETGQDLIVVE